MSNIKLPREKVKAKVEVYSENLMVAFSFENKKDADSFFCEVIKSISVTGANLLIDGKFAGARDGAGS